MPRKIVLQMVLVAVMCCFAPVLPAGNADDFWKFYEQHPELQDFYPFGTYGGAVGEWSPLGQEPKFYNQVLTDTLAENGFNVIWGGAIQRVIEWEFGKQNVPQNPVLSAFGQWYYGEELTLHEMKSMPSLAAWMRYNYGALKNFQRNDPLLDKAEMAVVEKDKQGVLEFARKLARDYPGTVIGFVSDDEPSYLAPAIAAIRLIEKYTGKQVTTCIPSWGAFKMFITQMQPMTGDWYPTGDGGRDSWSFARNMRWIRENFPDRIFYVIPLASAYPGGHEATKPWLKDSRPARTELRMQAWQAIAGGCKGFFYYNPGGWIAWAGGEDNLLNVLLKPNNDLWEELGALAQELTAIGPLLLSCRPDADQQIALACGKVWYPEFQGPALDYGLLKDIKHSRYYLIPWNNNVDRPEAGAMTLPAALVAGKKIYDLARLEEVACEADGALRVTLPAGGGRIYLLAAPEEYAQAKETVLRHRVRYPRVMFAMRVRIARQNRAINLTDAAKLADQARGAEAAGAWKKAAALYTDAAKAIDAEEKKVVDALPTRTALDRVARLLTDTDDLFRTHARIFEIPINNQHLHYAHYPNKHVGREIRDWVSLVGMYYDALARYRGGRMGAYLVADILATVEDLARSNQRAVQDAITKRLAEVRAPIKVAYITPDRNEMEYVLMDSWAYENFTVAWFAPDGKGALRDEQKTLFNPTNFNAVWVHQLRYAAPADGATPVEPGKALMPELVTETAVKAIKAYVDGGGGLVLTGIAGLYPIVLGIEKTMPDRIREATYYPNGFTVGLAAGPGCDKHPLFKGLKLEGLYTGANFPNVNFVAECAWEKNNPSGTVVACELDDVFGRIDEYAAVVEYGVGQGNILVLGGRAVDFTPGSPLSLSGTSWHDLRDRVRQVLLNGLVYCGGKERFEPDRAAIVDRRGQVREKHICLPLEGWLFRTDPAHVGLKENWFAKDLDVKAWKPIRVGANWESQGFDYDGYAWYRIAFTAANRPGKKTLLHFGAVDEQAIIYIDGRRAGAHEEGLEGWDKPFAVDITPLLSEKEEPHLLAVQVHDQHSAGGIWKPVSLRYEDKK